MKLPIFIVLLLVVGMSVEAQHVEVKYKRVVVPEIDFGGRWQPSGEQKRKILAGMEDKNYNEYSYFTLKTDGKNSTFVHDTTFNVSTKKKDEGMFWMNMKEIHPTQMKNLKTGEYFQKAPEEIESDLCMHDSLINKDEWVLGKNKKIFADLLCFDAYMITEEKDTIKVWYAPKVRISDGPQKYSGLPGLIMALEEKNIHFVAEELKMKPGPVTVEFPQNTCMEPKKFNEEYQKLVRAYYINKNN